MMNGKKYRILLLYESMIPSVRLCGHSQLEEMDRNGQVEYRACQLMRISNTELNWADVVMLSRLDNWFAFSIARQLKAAGKYLIYIMDDDLLNVPLEISSAQYYSRSDIRRYIRAMIEMSDAIVSPSTVLLERYALDGRKAILIEEPAIDPVSYMPHDQNMPIKIGFAGSIDRVGDIESILRDALIRIKQEYTQRVQFEFFGAIPSFADEIQANVIPYCDSYEGYRKQLNALKWDIGLAPIPDSPFHECKHYNKYIEYGAAGIIGVFSNHLPYIRLLETGKELMLCSNTPSAWEEKIKCLIDDDAKREELRKRTVEDIVERFSVPSVTREFARAFFETVELKMPKHSGWYALPIYKVCSICRRGLWAIRKHGWRLPCVLVRKIRQRNR